MTAVMLQPTSLRSMQGHGFASTLLQGQSTDQQEFYQAEFGMCGTFISKFVDIVSPRPTARAFPI